MSITVAPFDRNKHLDAAASLLAERHRRHREADPRMPASYEVPAAVAPFIEQALAADQAMGVVALQGGDVVGFSVMSATIIPQSHFLASFFPLRLAAIPYAAHATAAGMEYDAYRELYAVLADHFVKLGFFDQGFNYPATDHAARDAFVSLGFGQGICAALRGVEPPARAANTSIELHAAATEDAQVVFDLSEELTLHHAKAPIFNAYIRESDAASHDMQRGLMSDPANAHWVAYDKGRPLGMNTFMPPGFLSPMTVPDGTVYLFQGIVTHEARTGGVGTAILARATEWAREAGHAHIALHFATANLSGARFWQSSGFRPVEYGMRRHIDERIAWANK